MPPPPLHFLCVVVSDRRKEGRNPRSFLPPPLQPPDSHQVSHLSLSLFLPCFLPFLRRRRIQSPPSMYSRMHKTARFLFFFCLERKPGAKFSHGTFFSPEENFPPFFIFARDLFWFRLFLGVPVSPTLAGVPPP